MNAMNILDAVGNVKDAYVWDAQLVRDGQCTVNTKRVTLGRIWLIAAVVALMVFLLGCCLVLRLKGCLR